MIMAHFLKLCLKCGF